MASVTDPIDEASEFVLLDLGDGRQLAQFGPLVVDRPYPAASDVPVAHPVAWATADLRYERPDFGGSGQWVAVATEPPQAWTMRHAGLTFELRPTESGQVGFFGEQVEPWRWLRAAVRDLAPPPRPPLPPEPDPDPDLDLEPEPEPSLDPALDPARPTILNLFAYTGGATLAAAAEGAAVTHVDASRPAVAWARHNAELSGLADAPVRWIVDDALAFVRREARRGRRFDGIVLDPPSYGHGPKGERWTLLEHLPLLLEACLSLLQRRCFVLLTAHAEGLRAMDLGDALADALVRAGRRGDAALIEAGGLELVAASGNRAPAGVYARLRT
jgi:23S rRNA (cytosine1962-C5)-methyltransferase